MNPEKPPCPLFTAPFCFLRHGETEVNRLGLTAGATDVPLNPSGWEQAETAAQQLKGRGIDAIYSSPLKRAHDTAARVADALGLPIAIVPELAERNWGELEGKPRELRVRDATPPGGEGPEEFARRTLAGLARIPRSGLPLIVAHSGTFRVLCARLGVEAPAAPIQNARPLRFVPPPAAGSSWTVEAL
jgi:broad specificity phosphatase PhoE